MPNKEEYLDSVRSSEILMDEKDQKCAPTTSFKDGSCITTPLLVKMAESYNDMFAKNKIKLYPNVETLNPGKYKRYLLKEFSNRLSDVCDNQRCWLKQDFINKMNGSIKTELTKMTFRPSGPEGQFTWLNTLDINKVMSQYEKKYKGFKFLGAVPIDFDDLESLGIKDLQYDKLINEGYDKLGIIFNLDEHYKSGSHWVASYADLKKGKVYYYDSYGIEPEKRIRKYMRRVTNAIKKKNNISEGKIDVRHNKVRQQFKNSECGVFSISFILRSLQGKTFDEIMNSGVHDDEINECRKVYFT